MKVTFIVQLLIGCALLISCSGNVQEQPETDDKVSLIQTVVDQAITAHGGELYDRAEIEFDFRGRHYVSIRDGGKFQYERIFPDTLEDQPVIVRDVLTNEFFERFVDGAEFTLTDKKKRKEAAVRACHAYIWERDKDDPCICCGEPITQRQAGHYIPAGQNPKIKFDENNIHVQNLNCNYFKGGDSGMYRVNLIKKIGLEKVQRLESLKGGIDNRTASHLLHIEQHYKKKLKQLIVRP